jgi:hypothetical protein
MSLYILKKPVIQNIRSLKDIHGVRLGSSFQAPTYTNAISLSNHITNPSPQLLRHSHHSHIPLHQLLDIQDIPPCPLKSRFPLNFPPRQ